MVFPTEDEVNDYRNTPSDLNKWSQLTLINILRGISQEKLDNPSQVFFMESHDFKLNSTDHIDVVVNKILIVFTEIYLIHIRVSH